MSGLGKNKVSFGPYQADLETQELWKYGRRLKIGGQPFGILAMLLERPGQLVTREELRAKLWSADTFVDFNQGLNAAVNKLRDCLTDSADDPKYIETLPRRGYRFIGEVGTAPKHPMGQPVLDNLGSSSHPQSKDAPPRLEEVVAREQWIEPAIFGRVVISYRWLAFVCLAIFLTGAGYWALSPKHSPARTAVGGPFFLGGNPRPASDPAFSPDGSRIAFQQIESNLGPSGIYVSTVEGEQLTQLLSSESSCCPVWSPDGKWIAFSRLEGDVHSISVISADGGLPRTVYSAKQSFRRGELDWSPDGKSLAFSADDPNGGTRIVALSVDNHGLSPLTAPSSDQTDWAPAYSPDGTRLAFLRSGKTGPPEEIFLAPSIGVVSGGSEHQLTSGESHILGPPAWTTDSLSIVFSSSPKGLARLWKISAKGGIAEPVVSAEVPSWHPALPRHSAGLAYQHIISATSIWRLDLDQLEHLHSRMVVISPNGRNEGPELSPNGKKLAFMSDRGGSMEIWISDPDGSYPIKLTNLGLCGSPEWSPDGRFIAFDVVREGRPRVYIVGVSGGEPIELVSGDSENMVPRWSRDGKWIYFASNRSGDDEVWKIPAGGGEAKQITHQGGFAAMESVDGKFLFYAKTRNDHPEIWQVPLKGGKEVLVSSLIRPVDWANWTLTSRGIFFVDNIGDHLPHLEFFDFSTQQVQALVTLNNDSFWLSSSDDGATVWYGQAAHNESNIMVQTDFR